VEINRVRGEQIHLNFARLPQALRVNLRELEWLRLTHLSTFTARNDTRWVVRVLFKRQDACLGERLYWREIVVSQLVVLVVLGNVCL